jgi:hypothetical protein
MPFRLAQSAYVNVRCVMTVEGPKPLSGCRACAFAMHVCRISSVEAEAISIRPDCAMGVVCNGISALAKADE